MLMPLIQARLDSHCAADTLANVCGLAGEGDAGEADGYNPIDETLDEVLVRLASLIFVACKSSYAEV